MPASTSFANNALLLVMNATSWAGIAQNIVSSPDATIAVTLHTAAPGVGGNMATSEVSYVGFARGALARSGSGIVVTGNSASPAADILFPEPPAGSSGTVTHISFGRPGGGATQIHMYGTGAPNITITEAVAPKVKTATTLVIT